MRPYGWIALLLVAASLSVFLQVLEFEFVGLDDYGYVVQNPHLRDGLSREALWGAFRPYFSNWIPLTALSLQLDYALYGLDPAGYHFTNVALHTLSAVLLFFGLTRLTGEVWRSGFVAAVFAVHPLHVESVAWISERKDALSGVFWMLTLLAYGHYREQPASIPRYLWVLLCLALGLLAKPTLVTLPFVLLLLDYWPLGRLRRRDSGALRLEALRPALVEKLPMFVLVGGASVVTFVVQRSSGSMGGLTVLPAGLRLANAVESYAVYALKSLWPSGLAANYPHPLASIDPWSLAASAVFLLGASVIVFRVAAARPYAPVGWLWFLGTLVPMIGIVQVGMQARADRYMYFPLIGLSILAAWGAADLAERWRVERSVLGALAMASLAALAAAAWVQVGTWRNNEVLNLRALEVTESNYLAHKALGNELLRQQRVTEAEQNFAQAALLAPGWSPARLGLADVDVVRGRIAEALQGYREVLERDPSNMGAAGRYGLALGLAGRYAEARVQLSRALHAHRGTAELYRAMAEIEAALGNSVASVRHGREALRLMPDYIDAANNLAWTLATCHDPRVRNPEEAVQLIEAAALGSDDPQLLDTLAAAYAAAGRFDRAVATANRAAALAGARGDAAMERGIRSHLSLYRLGRPFVSPPPAYPAAPPAG